LGDFFLTFVRVAAIVFLLPGVGESYVSNRYKLAISVIISFSLFAVSSDHVDVVDPHETEFWSKILMEALYGLTLGITIRAAVFALQIAGTIIAQSSSIAQIFGGSVSNDAQSTVSNILSIGGITLLMTTGFLESVVIFISNSYDWLPLANSNGSAQILELIVDTLSNCFSLAFQLSLPFLALSLFYNITLGTINRAMPQLLVSFVGAPAIIAASISLLIISAEPLLNEWKSRAFGIELSSGR
jgi:flagellar biosynthetic protein FliR